MLYHDTNKKTVTIQNARMLLRLNYCSGLVIEELSLINSYKKTNIDRDAFSIKIHDKKFSSKDFKLTNLAINNDSTEDLVTFAMTCDSEKIKIKVHFLNSREKTITVIYQVYDSYLLGVPTKTYFSVPLLSGIEANNSNDIYRFPLCNMDNGHGEDVLKSPRKSFYDSDATMPLVVTDSKGQCGFSINFPSESDLSDSGATQNVNKKLSAIKNKDDLARLSVSISPDASFNDTVELEITGINSGWPEAFSDCRNKWQKRYDFHEYRREDFKWFSPCVVNNFTFLYGEEGFDFTSKKIDVKKLISQGLEFGGYDTVTIWNQYPRLGIDKRSQWDFYDDFPGGRQAIKEAVEEFHQSNVKVFLPYIPWDRGPTESEESMGNALAKIIADTDADGFQLDTMTDIPLSYRRKLDKIKPGIIFTSQFHPSKKLPTEIITTSWDEFWREDPMPEVDLLRFMCPEHLAPVISRWLRYEDKWTLIKRAEFGAEPIVIWQDIFGRWMEYSKEQKKRIKTYKEVYLKYKNIYQCKNPIPLLSTHRSDVFCNVFSDEGAQIYSIYNNCDDTIPEGSVDLYHNGSDAEIILGEGSATVEKNRLTVSLKPKEVMHVLVK